MALPKNIKKWIFWKKICQKWHKNGKNFFLNNGLTFCVIFEILTDIGYGLGILVSILCLTVEQTHVSNNNVLKFQLRCQ